MFQSRLVLVHLRSFGSSIYSKKKKVRREEGKINFEKRSKRKKEDEIKKKEKIKKRKKRSKKERKDQKQKRVVKKYFDLRQRLRERRINTNFRFLYRKLLRRKFQGTLPFRKTRRRRRFRHQNKKNKKQEWPVAKK